MAVVVPRGGGGHAARRVAVAAVALLGGVAALGSPRLARADEFDGASVIFARGAALYRVDARGKNEVEIAQLPAGAAPATVRGKARPPPTVRALRTDADGSVLLVDLAGSWAWMPLGGGARSLTSLPCGDGPAQLADDGSAVLCRAPGTANRSIVVELGPASPASLTSPASASASASIDIPPGAARIAGSGAERRLVWADAAGVWTAPLSDLRRKTRAAQGIPVRSFLPSPDGLRAIAVYADQVFADLHHTRAAEVLMTLQLDGQGARRKAIRDGVPVEWSHDAQWVLVQDGASTCVMRVSGGQYKCWRGLTAASLSSDGRWALALGNRDGSRSSRARPAAGPAGKAGKAGKAGRAGKAAAPARPAVADADPPRPGDKPWDHIDEPSNEPEAGDAPPANDDVSIELPTGPLALYRLRLEGAFTDRPTLLVKVIDGAAVWVPGAP
jgi:hypothetical protein